MSDSRTIDTTTDTSAQTDAPDSRTDTASDSSPAAPDGGAGGGEAFDGPDRGFIGQSETAADSRPETQPDTFEAADGGAGGLEAFDGADQRQPVADEQQSGAADDRQPIADEQDQAVTAGDEREPATDEQERPVADEQQESTVAGDEEQEPPAAEEHKQKPATGDEQEPVVAADEEPVSQDQPTADEEQEPVAEEQDDPGGVDRTYAGYPRADLVAAAEAADRNGLTKAGRALQKHGDRDDSVFPKSTPTTPDARNKQGLEVVNDILDDPEGRVVERGSRQGPVIDIFDSSGRGVRYGQDGRFIGFLEPLRRKDEGV